MSHVSDVEASSSARRAPFHFQTSSTASASAPFSPPRRPRDLLVPPFGPVHRNAYHLFFYWKNVYFHAVPRPHSCPVKPVTPWPDRIPFAPQALSLLIPHSIFAGSTSMSESNSNQSDHPPHLGRIPTLAYLAARATEQVLAKERIAIQKDSRDRIAERRRQLLAELDGLEDERVDFVAGQDAEGERKRTFDEMVVARAASKQCVKCNKFYGYRDIQCCGPKCDLDEDDCPHCLIDSRGLAEHEEWSWAVKISVSGFLLCNICNKYICNSRGCLDAHYWPDDSCYDKAFHTCGFRISRHSFEFVEGHCGKKLYDRKKGMPALGRVPYWSCGCNSCNTSSCFDCLAECSYSRGFVHDACKYLRCKDCASKHEKDCSRRKYY